MSAVQTYHSAQCICDLGMNDSRLCTWNSCGICSILKSGFESFEFGARSNSGRWFWSAKRSKVEAHFLAGLETGSTPPQILQWRTNLRLLRRRHLIEWWLHVKCICHWRQLNLREASSRCVSTSNPPSDENWMLSRSRTNEESSCRKDLQWSPNTWSCTGNSGV